jgi:copper chaperone CopZ
MKVTAMVCGFCTMIIEKTLKGYPGVRSVQVNVVQETVLVEADTMQPGTAELAAALKKLGYKVQLFHTGG